MGNVVTSFRQEFSFLDHFKSGFNDLFRRTTSSGAVIPGLDGVRAIAAMLVLLAHSKFGPASAGATGVWIFFSLSGFLLFQPFANDQFKYHHRNFIAYLIRRIFRILPLYFMIVPLYVWLLWGGDWDRLLLHYTFERADWLFWTVKTELLFYLVLPLFAIGVFLFESKEAKLIFLSLLMIALWLATEQHRLVTITASNANTQFMVFVTPFVLGILLAQAQIRLTRATAIVLFYLSCLALVFLMLDTAWVQEIRFELFKIKGEKLAWQQRWLVYPICVVLIMAVANGGARWLEMQPLKAIGVAGYGFYLWHSLVINLFRRNEIVTDPAILFIVGGGITVVLAMVTYILIERPGIRIGRALARRVAQ